MDFGACVAQYCLPKNLTARHGQSFPQSDCALKMRLGFLSSESLYINLLLRLYASTLVSVCTSSFIWFHRLHVAEACC